MKKLQALFLAIIFYLPVSAQQYEFSKNGERVVEAPTDNANASGIERFNIHFQTTYIYQYKPAFTAPYSDSNSLSPLEDHENSLTATLYIGLRLWKGAQLFINPELAGGSGLNGARGMGGSSNGETFRVGDPSPSLYLGNAYFKQTFMLREKQSRKFGVLNTEAVESDQNQLAGYEPKNYLRFYIGKICLGDLFDDNAYSKSPREQFMNWALMNNGAWDYAANTRGYTQAFVTELQLGQMNYKAGIATLPIDANGPDLNDNISESYAVNAEVCRSFTIGKRAANVRLLGFYNRAVMGRYLKAIAVTFGYSTPDISSVRETGNRKYGFGISFDHELSNTFGVFARAGWNDGLNETWCYTEIDQTASVGLSANGNKWKRPNDNCGIALVANGISADHQAYLSAGGKGFILGDGRLNYGPEMIGEVYYSFKPIRTGIWLSGDYQFCLNPGYNADRGPVSIFSCRLHVAL